MKSRRAQVRYRVSDMKSHAIGIHHVTAICGDPQRNIDFYTGFLGLRLVKCGVNFDDPTSYHLHYGDEVGHPGTVLSFFPWSWMPKGRQGTGQAAVVSLAIPPTSIRFWSERLSNHGVRFDGPIHRFDEEALIFRDPDGLILELVTHPDADTRPAWMGAPIPASDGIRGIHSVTLWEEGFRATADLLLALGFQEERNEGARFRLVVDDGAPGTIIDIRCMPDFWPGTPGRGIAHHIALRVLDDETQRAARDLMARRGLDITPILDRQYYHSLYAREPGGVLIEISTDGPGYTVDEPARELGKRLVLPPWIEPSREEIEEVLPPLHLPEVARIA